METGSVRQSFCVPRNFGSNVTWPIEGKMHAHYLESGTEFEHGCYEPVS